MHNLFRSGAAFMIVAAISFIVAAIVGVKGLMTDNFKVALFVVFMGNAVVWFAIAIATRNKNKEQHKQTNDQVPSTKN